MTQDVLDIVSGALRPETTAAAAERLGEAPAAVTRFLSAGAPAVLQGLIARAEAPGGAEALLGAMRRLGAARALADPLARLEPGAQPDAELVDHDLPGRLGRHAGVSEAGAGALAAMLTPLALGAVARIAPTPLTPDTLERTLRAQGDSVARALPPGWDARDAAPPPAEPVLQPEAPSDAAPAPVPTPFLEPVADTAPPQPIPVVQPPAAVPDGAAPAGGGLSRWLLIALALLMVLALVWVLLGNLGAGEPGPSPAEPTPAAGTGAPSP